MRWMNVKYTYTAPAMCVMILDIMCGKDVRNTCRVAKAQDNTLT